MRVPLSFVLALLGIAAGCAGNVKMSRLSPSALQNGRAVKGVIVYPPVLVKLTYSFTTRVGKDGKVLGQAMNHTCRQTIQKEELSTMADLDQPMLISNASGILSAAKFSVEIEDGLLTTVNAEPTQKASDLLTAASSVIKEVGALSLALDSTAACNASPILSAITRASIPKE